MRAYTQLIGAVVEIRGVVKEDVDIRASGESVIRLGDISYGSVPIRGTIWITTPNDRNAQRGDTITVTGKLSAGFGNFAATMYRSTITKVQRPQPGDIALHVRDSFAHIVREVIPEPQASLGLGYLLGQRRALPPDLSESLQIAGLTHVIVASGYNLTILVRLARRLFMRISRFSALAAASGMVLSFIAITGMSPSMARAGIVTGLSLLAWYYGRKISPFVLLPLAAAITVLINPGYAWGDIGWQLSFAAFAGVMIVAPLIQAYFFGDKKPGVIRQILGETISAQIATLPILIVAFGQMSNIALVANVLVLPLVPLAMLLVFASGIGMMILPVIGSLIAIPTTWVLQYMTGVASYLAQLPWALSEIKADVWFVAIYYIVLSGICFFMWRATCLSLKDANIIE
jgi:competence protein ComEC